MTHTYAKQTITHLMKFRVFLFIILIARHLSSCWRPRKWNWYRCWGCVWTSRKRWARCREDGCGAVVCRHGMSVHWARSPHSSAFISISPRRNWRSKPTAQRTIDGYRYVKGEDIWGFRAILYDIQQMTTSCGNGLTSSWFSCSTTIVSHSF